MKLARFRESGKVLNHLHTLLLCALLLSVAGVLSARSVWTETASIETISRSAKKSNDYAAAATTTLAERLPRALITIRATGFDPAEIGLGPGAFLLAVDNKSGLDEVTLHLTNEGGVSVRELRLSPRRYKWREKMILLPGKYFLTEANHANWVCRITVAP